MSGSLNKLASVLALLAAPAAIFAAPPPAVPMPTVPSTFTSSGAPIIAAPSSSSPASPNSTFFPQEPKAAPRQQFQHDDAGTEFYPFSIDEDALAGAPDRSALNQPLDATARVFVRDGHFFRAGADGKAQTGDDSRVRLYGVNLSFSTNFPNERDAVRLAKRLRKLGFNAVRLHHMDTSPDTRADPPRSILLPGPYPTFNQDAMARLRNLIEVLRREGIYVDLNLHVGYRFRADVDQVPRFADNANSPGIGTPVNVYYPRMVALQETYARQLLRGLGLRNNPALAMVEINNESSLLSAWQRREWRDAVPPAYAPELRRQWQAWLVKRYGSMPQACAAWKTCAAPDAPIELLTSVEADAAAAPVAALGQLGQIGEKVARKWRALSTSVLGDSGNGTGAATPTGDALRVHDFLQFLAYTDRAYFVRLRSVVQQETDTLVPVTGTQMGYGGALNFDSETEMDYIDEHFYVDHPDYPGGGRDRTDWRMRDSAIAGGEWQKLLALAFRRDARKPFVVSEFSQPFPNRQGAEILPMMAAVGAAQDWDGLFFFDYMDGDTWAVTPDNFTLAGDWSKYVTVGQAALMFRGGLMGTLPTRRNVAFGPEARLAVAANRDWGYYDSWFAAQRGAVPAQVLQQRTALDLVPVAAGNAAATSSTAASQAGAQEAAVLRAPNNEIEIRTAAQIILLRSQQLRGFYGAFKRRERVGDDVASIELLGRGRAFAAVLLTALDGRPLAASRRLLLTTASADIGTQPGSMPPRPKQLMLYKGDSKWWTLEPDPTAPGRPSGSTLSSAPMWMERNEARLTLATQSKKIAVYPLDGAGRRMAPLGADRVSLAGGILSVQLQADPVQATPWYELVDESGTNNNGNGAVK